MIKISNQEQIEAVRDDIQDYEKALDEAEKYKISHDDWIETLKANIQERKEYLSALKGEDKCGHDDNQD